MRGNAIVLARRAQGRGVFSILLLSFSIQAQLDSFADLSVSGRLECRDCMQGQTSVRCLNFYHTKGRRTEDGGPLRGMANGEWRMVVAARQCDGLRFKC